MTRSIAANRARSSTEVMPAAELAASGGPAVETSYWHRAPTWWQSDDPATDFLRFLYKPSADSGVVEAAPVDEERARLRAMQAFHLFESWHVIPGTRADKTIDADVLETWIKSARTRASEVGRLGVADLHIGKVLATSPKGADGHWPAEAVRDAIDLFRSRDLEDGFTTGVYNRRGATTRGLRDGGALERAEAARYRAWASAVRLTHPRTGAALDTIAEGYERDAVRHDERAAQVDYEA